MATREIKTRFKLEGEAEFKRAMTDAANATKVLDSEMKLAKAQFEQTGDAQQYAAEQARILREKIEEQKSAVQAAERAMQQLADNGVSKNDKTYQMWATRLNEAKSSLTGLENTFQSVDRKISLEQAASAVDSLQKKMESVIKTGARAVKALWSWETDAGKWADDLATKASQAGLDVETYQAWDYASLFIDTSVDDIAKSIRKMESDIGSASEETAKVFNQLAVSTRNADGSARDATAVFFDVVDALGRVEDATTRGIYAQKLLGSHYNNLNPLIEAGSKAYEEMADEGRRVAVVSEETVTKLGGLNDQQEQMNAALEKTKMTLLGSLAEPFEKVAAGITEATTALNSFLESDEGKQALSELGEALNGLIAAFLGEDNGKGTFAAIVDTAKEAVNGFTAALKWIKNNNGAVKAALIAIGGAWAGLKLTGDVLRFVQGVEAFKGLVGKGAGSAASAATGAASGGFWTGLASAVAKAIPLAAGAAVMLTPASTDKDWDAYYHNGKVTKAGREMGLPETQAEYNRWTDAQRAAKESEYLWEGFKNPATRSKTAPSGAEFGTSGADIYNAIKAAVTDGMDAAAYTQQKYGSADIGTLFNEKTKELDSMLSSGLVQKGDDLYFNLINQLTEELEAAVQDAKTKGQEAAEGFASSIEDNAQQAVDAAQQMGQSVTEETDREMSFMELIGENAATGLANGIDARAQDAVNAATRLANQVEAALRNTLDIHSPSRVLMRMGEFTAQGFAQGIDDGMARVEAAAARMSRAAAVEPTYRSGGSWGADPAGAQAGASAPGGNGGSVNATIVMDKTVVGRMVAPIVNETIGAAVAAARR